MEGGRIDYTLGFEADAAAIKAAADEMQRCNVQWDGAEQAANNLDAAEKRQGKTTLDLTKNKQDLKKALSLVAYGSQEAGVAANFLMGRMAGLVGVGMYLIQQTKQGIASLMDSIATPVWEGFVGIVQKQRKAFQEAALAAGIYQREVDRAQFAQDSRSEAAGRLQELLTARLKGEDALLEKRKANEIAAVNDAVMREEAKQSRIAEIERKYAALKLERERQAEVQRLALAQLRTKMDLQEQTGLEEIRAGLIAGRDRLGSKENIDAKEDVTRKRLEQERQRLQELDDQIAANEANHGMIWNAPTEFAQYKYLKQQREGTAGNVAQLTEELGKMESKNPARRRAIAEYNQAIGWVEGDIRGLAGSANAAQRGAPTAAMASLLGLNASAAAAGAPQMPASKFDEMIYKEMVKLNRNLEKPFARQ